MFRETWALMRRFRVAGGRVESAVAWGPGRAEGLEQVQEDGS